MALEQDAHQIVAMRRLPVPAAQLLLEAEAPRLHLVADAGETPRNRLGAEQPPLVIRIVAQKRDAPAIPASASSRTAVRPPSNSSGSTAVGKRALVPLSITTAR